MDKKKASQYLIFCLYFIKPINPYPITFFSIIQITLFDYPKSFAIALGSLLIYISLEYQLFTI